MGDQAVLSPMEILLLLLFLLLIYAVAGVVLFGEDVINRAELERLGFTRAECDWKANLIRKNVKRPPK